MTSPAPESSSSPTTSSSPWSIHAPPPPPDDANKQNDIPIVIPSRVDERCFTFCTQRSIARTFQVEPVCHTLCWRKVYEYERRMMDARFGSQEDVLFHYRDPLPYEKGTRDLPEHLAQQYARLAAVATACLLERTARWKDVQARRRAESTALLLEILRNHVKPGKAYTGDVDGRMARRIEREREALFQRLRLVMLEPPYPNYRTPGEFLWPFPPPRNNNWSFFRGHYITYARGTQKSGEHWSSMKNLFLTEGWEAAHALLRQGRDVGAVLDSNMLSRKEGPRTMGIQQLQGEAEAGTEKKVDPNYIAIISVEHLPPVLYKSLINRAQRIYDPVVSLLERYRESFASGQQRHTAYALWGTALDPEDGPLGTLKKLGAAFERRRKEEEREREEREGKKSGGL
ncbi:hypothetical protein CALVIDRAFT_598479 [Calocera viscosa TUFC12733]|uniref:Uncharacterized protein n=1 Tax=Calocera viscosa (strain TUFC12733) TaxID=1330018 RepID=A0A167LY15_CALVF|nr:hypothetical protein CALVIDRAFT_598479 [Calocera viscosa TUFC12733]